MRPIAIHNPDRQQGKHEPDESSPKIEQRNEQKHKKKGKEADAGERE